MTKPEAISEITRLLVQFYQPVRIYLFGSVARGEDGPDSDLDFCVVLPDDSPRDLYRRNVHQALSGVPTAADIVRFPLSDFDGRATHVLSSLPATIVREGTLLYDSGCMAA